jgi:hypothetical protein
MSDDIFPIIMGLDTYGLPVMNEVTVTSFGRSYENTGPLRAELS